ncbi:FAD-dependent oxidoreductase [Ascoidea rubescens DSM 1968]|uniref:Nucleotide-binding domain-containing protein n=1 Tax=Ascoidea rubescens DSM 1968 TaxID=1344418 RepID=A0A1D2VF93_9ASCO|nr:nucleotide-binding domain-containing protein [Ascoidea rubescens DSM 1968]ODV60183.1 nucleotide-binding domain-containing protein [Ascoidea rubescens DSM 1968]
MAVCNNKKVIVVGAGITGLTTAYELSKQGYKVLIIAKNLPTDAKYSYDYASAFAGAHFRPIPSYSDQDVFEMKLNRATFKKLKEFAAEFPESSVKFVKGIDYLEEPSLGYVTGTNIGYNAQNLNDFKILSENVIPFNNIKYGAEYESWIVNAPHLLKFLFNRLTVFYNVKFIQLDVLSLKQVFEASSCFADFSDILGVINATGRGLQYYGGYDPEVFFVRSQTLLVSKPNCPKPPLIPYYNKTLTIQHSDGKFVYVLKRPIDGGFIIGGTKQINDLCPFERASETQELIESAKPYFKELLSPEGEFNVQKVNVGIRAVRKGGLKLSKVLIKEQGNKFLIDAYGAGAMAHELSFGIAEKVVEMVNDKYEYISAKL